MVFGLGLRSRACGRGCPRFRALRSSDIDPGSTLQVEAFNTEGPFLPESICGGVHAGVSMSLAKAGSTLTMSGSFPGLTALVSVVWNVYVSVYSPSSDSDSVCAYPSISICECPRDRANHVECPNHIHRSCERTISPYTRDTINVFRTKLRVFPTVACRVSVPRDICLVHTWLTSIQEQSLSPIQLLRVRMLFELDLTLPNADAQINH